MYPHQMIGIIGAQAAALNRAGRAWSADAVLDSLARQDCRRFVALLRPHVS